jgi:hypothetical protein
MSGSTCPWKALPCATNISGSTRSQQSFDRARAWIENCAKNHKLCNASSRSVIPDRVLDIGLNRDPDDEKSPIVLIETNADTLRPEKYACLSYCWGAENHITTTSKTIGDRKACIAWRDLPITFQHATSFAARLKIRYLWIDSLCIVQDDEEDWSVQASKMPSIYENAYVTLAAIASSSSTGGCFSDSSSEFMARDFAVVDRDGESYQIFARRHLPHFLMPDGSVSWELNQEFPLLKRAWVLQERLLSPRVLHFARHELMWECMESAACECSFLDKVDRERLVKIAHHRAFTPNPLDFTASLSRRLHAASVNPDRASLAERWRALVSTYSSLAMTYQKDKLQALSGLAQQVNRTMGDTYVAGLWRGTLIGDMLWEANDPSERPSPWRAPSWSWASVINPVNYVSGLRDSPLGVTEYAKITEVVATPAGKTLMGQLSSASLEVTSEFTLCHLVIFSRDESMVAPTAPYLFVNGAIIKADRSGDSDEPLSFVTATLSTDVNLAPSTNLTRPPQPGEEVDGTRFLAMRLAKAGAFEYSLLLTCIDHPSGKYERVGIVGELVLGNGPRKFPWGDGSKTFYTTITLL